MSQFPCAIDGRRIQGQASTIYTAAVHGSWSTRKKLRLCQEHAVPLANELAQLGQLVWIGDADQTDDGDVPDGCHACTAYGAWILYVDSFIRGEDGRAYRAHYCDDHIGPAALKARLDVA